MAENDLQGNLQNYKLQLQQVEAALTTEPENEELLKLKTDLEEVIVLTCELIKTQLQEEHKLFKESLDGDADLSEGEGGASGGRGKTEWKAGDRCLALWTQDGQSRSRVTVLHPEWATVHCHQYYEATIESIDGEEVSLIFDSYRSAQVTTLEFIKEIPHGQDSKSKLKKQPLSKLREYQKKKKQKKQQRFKQLEEEREVEKNKWLAFSNKSSKKGIIRKSIFASPDNVNGRVGIGTCGVSGKGMTEFASAEKWRKGV